MGLGAVAENHQELDGGAVQEPEVALKRNFPGLGRIAIESILSRDYPVTMAIVLLFTAFYSLINLAVDLLYGVVDPRIRLQGGRTK